MAVSEEQWNTYYGNLNLDNIQAEKEVTYAIINTNTSGLDLPTEDILTDSDMDEAYNALQETTLKINEPVVILQESKDGKWLFAASNEYIGWVKKENCSLFESREDWLNYQNQEKYIIVIKDFEIPEKDCKILMGTKLYISDNSESNESECNIMMPMSNSDGSVNLVEMKITDNDAVCTSYLTFTRENILKLAFWELGDPYGWGGVDGKRDCSSYIKDVYACFGFCLPRNSRLQQTMPDVSKELTSLSETDKSENVKNAMAGDLLGINGHEMMYLGEANGKYYIISMLSSYVPEDVTEDFASAIENVSKVTVNSLNVKRRNGNTWLQELNSVVGFGKK